MVRTALLTLWMLALSAPVALASPNGHDGGEGLWGETNDKVVTYVFAGFRPHKPIFGHFFRNNKLVVTHKYGKAGGPCGILHAKSKLFPGNGPRGAKYKVQFDDSKKVNPKATPKIVTSLGTVF